MGVLYLGGLEVFGDVPDHDLGVLRRRGNDIVVEGVEVNVEDGSLVAAEERGLGRQLSGLLVYFWFFFLGRGGGGARGGEKRSVLCRRRRQDGSTFWLRTAKAPPPDASQQTAT